jgi:hypothetical protein
MTEAELAEMRGPTIFGAAGGSGLDFVESKPPAPSLSSPEPEPVGVPLLGVPPASLPGLGGEEPRGIENMLNLRVMKFIADATTTSKSTPPASTTTTASPARAKRVASKSGVSKSRAVNGTVDIQHQEDERPVDTAPPEISLPEAINREKNKHDAEDALTRLADKATRQAKPGQNIQGGNIKRVIDFDEALRVTVPYGEEVS